MFAQRIVGLQLGEVVYDGAPSGLTPDVLTRIYGEEDWEAATQGEADTVKFHRVEGVADPIAEH